MYFSVGLTDEEIAEKELKLREREVRSMEYTTWIELAKFVALIAVPVGAMFGIDHITKSIKRTLHG